MPSPDQPICNVCGGNEFATVRGRVNAKCKGCNSLERTRLMWLYIDRIPLDEQSRVLHIAPERGIAQRLTQVLAPDNYVIADLDPSRYADLAATCQPIDLCDLGAWPNDEFDVIIHSHVIEHVPCTVAYPLFHLQRMLKPTGSHVAIVPFMSGRYDESLQELTEDERNVRFGQFDHVRRFGVDDRETHLGKLMRLPDEYDATTDFDEATLRTANIPESEWRGYGISTVMVWGKDDWLLTA